MRDFDTLVILPDSQSLVRWEVTDLGPINMQATWCLANKERLRIGAVIHVGDFLDYAELSEANAQWTRTYNAYSPLLGQIPFIPTQGNHDPDDVAEGVPSRALPGSLASQKMNALGSSVGYGLGDCIAQLGGTYQEGDWSNSWTLVTLASGRQVLIISLEFATRFATIAWAQGIIEANPGVMTIITTHAFMNDLGELYDGTKDYDPQSSIYDWTASEGKTAGEAIETLLVLPYNQVRLVFCGHHFHAHAQKSITRADGSKCHYIVRNYQVNMKAGVQKFAYSGNLLILRLLWDSDTIAGDVYSPYLDRISVNDGLDKNWTDDPDSPLNSVIRIRSAGISSMPAAAPSQFHGFEITPTESVVVKDLYFPLSSAPADFWDEVTTDGSDIRVTTNDGSTLCPREILGWDYANKTGHLYFSANGGTSWKITTGGGQAAPATAAAFGRNGVWDANAQIVCHFEDFIDSTGKRTLTAGTSTLVAGKVGNALSDTNSSSAHVTTNYVAQITGDLTVMAWFKANSVSSGWHRILETQFDTGFWLGYHPAQAKWGGGIHHGESPYGIWVELSLNEWHMLAIKRTGTAHKLIADNGSVTATETWSDAALTASEPLRIGHGYSTNIGIDGIIDEVRVWDRALSDDEITQYYRNLNAPASFWTVGDFT